MTNFNDGETKTWGLKDDWGREANFLLVPQGMTPLDYWRLFSFKEATRAFH